MEAWWPRFQQAIPELGNDLELIETATPRTFYDQTRRKLGMVGAVRNPSGASEIPIGPNSCVPNVFMVGDTTPAGAGVGAVTQAALYLADRLTS